MQPIKIEKPFQSLMTFSHSAGEKNILQRGVFKTRNGEMTKWRNGEMELKTRATVIKYELPSEIGSCFHLLPNLFCG